MFHVKQYGKVSTLYVWSWAVLWCTLAGIAITILYSLFRRVPVFLSVFRLPYMQSALVCFGLAGLALLGCLLLKHMLGMTFADYFFMLTQSYGLRVFLKEPVATTTQDTAMTQPQAVTSPLQLSALIWTTGSEAYAVLVHPHQVGGQSAAKAVEAAFKTECDALLPGFRSAGSSVARYGIIWHYYQEVDEDEDDEI